MITSKHAHDSRHPQEKLETGYKVRQPFADIAGQNRQIRPLRSDVFGQGLQLILARDSQVEVACDDDTGHQKP
jgi:hypothetical protein